jgi:uncharacterized membrane protein YhdT
MERLYLELDEHAGDWAIGPPPCALHRDTGASGICGRCRRPVCRECMVPILGDVRCGRCRRRWTRRLPSPVIATGSFLQTVLRRPWAAGVVLFFLIAGVILLLMPNAFRPKTPDLPDWLEEAALRAPLLQRAFRLSHAGSLFSNRNDSRRAEGCYERALSACGAYIEENPDAGHLLQVQLGIGRLLEKLDRPDEAANLYLQIVETGEDAIHAAGVAHFYLAQLHESTRKDPVTAHTHYERALQIVENEDAMLDRLIEFYATDRVASRDLYSVAALTDTVTSPSAVLDEIFAGLERCRAGGAALPEEPAFEGPESDVNPERVQRVGGE